MNTQSLKHPERRHHERRKSAAHHDTPDAKHAMQMGRYFRFAAMVSSSTAIGFAAMYLNVFEIDHVYFSWTRLFMALIMGGVMTAVMMAFMWGMYPDRKKNWGVLGIAAALLLAGLGLARSQATVGDIGYMSAMIPHHSIAILTSSRARIEDPRVRELADAIIAAQEKEIAQMKGLIAELERR